MPALPSAAASALLLTWSMGSRRKLKTAAVPHMLDSGPDHARDMVVRSPRGMGQGLRAIGARRSSSGGHSRSPAAQPEHLGQRLRRRFDEAMSCIERLGLAVDRRTRQSAGANELRCLERAQHGILEQPAAEAAPGPREFLALDAGLAAAGSSLIGALDVEFVIGCKMCSSSNDSAAPFVFRSWRRSQWRCFMSAVRPCRSKRGHTFGSTPSTRTRAWMLRLMSRPCCTVELTAAHGRRNPLSPHECGRKGLGVRCDAATVHHRTGTGGHRHRSANARRATWRYDRRHRR
jgi:hypothetical protein